MVRSMRWVLCGMVAAALVTSCAGQSGPSKGAEPVTSGAPSGEPPRSGDAPAPAGSCTGGPLEITPSEKSATDRCDATFYCPGARTILVTCDGENDGTGTSLCDCEERGKRASVNGTVPGEAPDSCIAAAGRCLLALGEPAQR